MFKVSQFISLPVINIFKSRIEGYVENVCFDNSQKSLTYIKIFDETNDTYKLVKFSDIFTFKDAIFIKNSSKITLYENLDNLQADLTNPLTSTAYSLSGALIGKVDEIEVLKNGHIESISVGEKSFTPSQIVGLGDQITTVSLDKKTSLSRFAPQRKKISNLASTPEPVVKIMSTPLPNENNYQFLLNRKIMKDIKAPNGEIIARQNSVINSSTITKLKYYGKLKELMLNSK